jgi:asparagine synthase (glutamine-hydrolysing)
MCGIVGIYSKYEKIMKERLQQATDRLIHRGPDSNGLWVHPQSHVGLGHTRLSVVDLEHGEQPIANENDRIHAVVNGEFYGYQEVQMELMRKGHKFRTNSDSEILLHLYEDHGLEALSYLRGEFAFILWDDRKE